MNKEKTKTVADDVYRALHLQWELLGRGDVCIELIITANNSWGISAGRRLNCTDGDNATLSSISKHDDTNPNYFG